MNNFKKKLSYRKHLNAVPKHLWKFGIFLYKYMPPIIYTLYKYMVSFLLRYFIQQFRYKIQLVQDFYLFDSN